MRRRIHGESIVMKVIDRFISDTDWLMRLMTSGVVEFKTRAS
jgi:hypothetical protein